MIDQLVETIARKGARPIARLLAKSFLTPNMITAFRFFIFIPPASFLFFLNTYLGNLVAVALCLLYAFFDYVDGELARLKSMQTEIGEWLDRALDWFATNLLLFAVAFGVFRTTHSLIWLAIGFTAIFGNIVCGFISFQFQHKFNFHHYTASIFREKLERYSRLSRSETLLKNIITPRSSSLLALFFAIRYPLMAGAIFNKMSWALLLIAISHNIFWMVMFPLFIICLKGGKSTSKVVKVLRELKTIKKFPN